jgi:hypothetical protein
MCGTVLQEIPKYWAIGFPLGIMRDLLKFLSGLRVCDTLLLFGIRGWKSKALLVGHLPRR